MAASAGTNQLAQGSPKKAKRTDFISARLYHDMR
jgi:hypothetical protein